MVCPQSPKSQRDASGLKLFHEEAHACPHVLLVVSVLTAPLKTEGDLKGYVIEGI